MLGLLASSPCLAQPDHADAPAAVVMQFLDAFEHADLDAVRATLAEQATMFTPFLAERLDGRDAIVAALSPVFDRLRARGPGPRYLSLEPSAMRTRVFGSAAVVSWHLPREAEIGRRSAVLEYRDAAWRIIDFHASSMPTKTSDPRNDNDDSDDPGAKTQTPPTLPILSEARGYEWFGLLGDRNFGLGRRDSERWIWDIDRRDRDRVLRVRERLGEDEFLVTSTTVRADGSERVTCEQMRRVRPNATTM